MHSSIRYIRHRHIDQKKWEECLAGAVNSLIYAKADYLNAMSPGWDALVLGDYEAIMPITHKRKGGIRYVCQPAFCQQLGVFYKDADTQKRVPDFLQIVSSKFRLVEIFLNDQNATQDAIAECTNFILPLHKNYADLAANYKNELTRNLKQSKKFNLQYSACNQAARAIELFRQQIGSRTALKPEDYVHFTQIAEKWLLEGRVLVRQVTQENGELLAMSLFLKDEKRIYNIAPTTLANGRTQGANHFLLDELIKEFSGSDLVLDFEGSDLPGVARFYQKFNPVCQPYYFYKSNTLPKWLRRWKK